MKLANVNGWRLKPYFQPAPKLDSAHEVETQVMSITSRQERSSPKELKRAIGQQIIRENHEGEKKKEKLLMVISIKDKEWL